MKKRKIILALGTNTSGEQAIRQAHGLLCQQLGQLKLSTILMTEPVGMMSPPFANALAAGTTTLGADEIRAVLKSTEQACGDSRELRLNKQIVMDIDLLQLGKHRYKEEDWLRPYVAALAEEICNE